MILPTIIGELLFWSPLIVIGILALFNPWFWTIFASVYVVWVGIVPAIPVQLLFIFTINKILKRFRRPENGSNK